MPAKPVVTFSDVRTFNGNVFVRLKNGVSRRKADAKRLADFARKRGFLARVVKVAPGKYKTYIRDKRR